MPTMMIDGTGRDFEVNDDNQIMLSWPERCGDCGSAVVDGFKVCRVCADSRLRFGNIGLPEHRYGYRRKLWFSDSEG